MVMDGWGVLGFLADCWNRTDNFEACGSWLIAVSTPSCCTAKQTPHHRWPAWSLLLLHQLTYNSLTEQCSGGRAAEHPVEK